jgi:hypothetical protein
VLKETEKVEGDNLSDPESGSSDEEEVEEEEGAGQDRFNKMIKSMIARLEYNGSLAAPSQYGRRRHEVGRKRKRQTDQQDNVSE